MPEVTKQELMQAISQKGWRRITSVGIGMKEHYSFRCAFCNAAVGKKNKACVRENCIRGRVQNEIKKAKREAKKNG